MLSLSLTKLHLPRLHPVSFLKQIRAANALYRQRCDLARMGPDQLRDIGLSERDRATELAKPIWSAPVHWKK